MIRPTPHVTHGDSTPGVPLRAVPPLENGANAGVRVPARARLTPLPEQSPEHAAELRTATDGSHRQLDAAPLLARLKRWASPPNPKAARPPSWDALTWNGDHGRHVPKTGWPRTASIAWSRTVALPVRASAVWLDWIARCPSRCLAVFVLYALLAHVPGLTWLPWIF